MRRPTRFAALALLAAIVLASSRTSRSHAKATLVLAEIFGETTDSLSLRTGKVARTRLQLPNGRADLYQLDGRKDLPLVVVVHGANPGGIDDPRVGRVATSLARAGRRVLVPALALGERTFERLDLDRITDALTHFPNEKDIVVVAFSFGAAFTIVALEQSPEIQSRIATLATVGTYYDLVHLLQGVTTGRVFDGSAYVEWKPASEARNVVTMILSSFLPEDQRDRFVAAHRAGDREAVPSEALPMYELMTNTDPTKTRELVGSLPDHPRSIIEEMSPARDIDRLSVPVLALHSTNDPAAPVSESELLVREVGRREQARLTKVRLFRHVTLTATARQWISDGGSLLSYVASILRVQEKGPIP